MDIVNLQDWDEYWPYNPDLCFSHSTQILHSIKDIFFAIFNENPHLSVDILSFHRHIILISSLSSEMSWCLYLLHKISKVLCALTCWGKDFYPASFFSNHYFLFISNTASNHKADTCFSAALHLAYNYPEIICSLSHIILNCEVTN